MFYKPVDLAAVQKYVNIPLAAKAEMLKNKPGWTYNGPITYGNVLLSRRSWVEILRDGLFKLGTFRVPNDLFLDANNWSYCRKPLKHVYSIPENADIPDYLIRTFDKNKSTNNGTSFSNGKWVRKETKSSKKELDIYLTTYHQIAFISSNIELILKQAKENIEAYHGESIKNIVFIKPEFNDDNHHRIEYVFDDEIIFGSGPTVLSAAIELYGKCYEENHNLNRLSIADIGGDFELDFLELINDEPTIICKENYQMPDLKHKLNKYIIGVNLSFINKAEKEHPGYKYEGRYELMEGRFHLISKNNEAEAASLY